jgi:hypothetical protein
MTAKNVEDFDVNREALKLNREVFEQAEMVQPISALSLTARVYVRVCRRQPPRRPPSHRHPSHRLPTNRLQVSSGVVTPATRPGVATTRRLTIGASHFCFVAPDRARTRVGKKNAPALFCRSRRGKGGGKNNHNQNGGNAWKNHHK